MEILVLLVGVAIGMAVRHFLGKRTEPGPSQPRAPEKPAESAKPAQVDVPAAPAPAAAVQPAPPSDIAGRLQPLRKTLEDFSDASAHAREIAELKEFKQAIDLLADPSVSAEALLDYAMGSSEPLAYAAFAAIPRRDDCAALLATVVPRLKHIANTTLYFALQACCGERDRPAVGAVAVDPDPYWADSRPALVAFDAYLRKRQELGDAPSFGDALTKQKQVETEPIREFLKIIDHPYAVALLVELDRWRGGTLNRVFLQSIGQFWNSDDDDLLIEHDAVREPLLTSETAITHSPPRSIVVVGELRTGKTSLLRLLARRLAPQGYTVFEAGGAQLMAGQSYFGELEGRIRRLQEELSSDKRVIWYVPDLHQLVSSGTHRGQSASILDQLLPSLASGRLVMVSECTPGMLVKIHQARPALRNVMDVIRTRAVTTDEAQVIAKEFAGRLERALEIAVETNVVPSALQLAAQYLGGLQLPGAVLDLIKASANRVVANAESILTRESVLATLSQVSGLPRAILDDREKSNLAQMREFFAARVIGQEEAVGAIVDRIAMLKAGLTDPGRPVGVFLFAGPTGTGKTELAKTLAEYLFGTAERLIRLDMSEFQTAESTWKILGNTENQADTPSLIQKVRKQPFAVVLLDEFEKAHSNVWDLFLQVFDDARLTDSLGQTADFRHTIIILTSNLGATSHQSAGLGFAPNADAFSQAQILRAVSQSFRPEFVNRLDKVIVFRPLTRDRMRDILLKELKRVLERRGLRNREWAVEWESSALEFLLDKGFSATMGARPLKRAVDQHLLAPLAATMVEHRFPSGDQFLFVRSDGQAIQVEFVDPDAPEQVVAPDAPLPEGTPAPGLGSTILQPAGTRAERDLLVRRAAAIQSELEAPPWEQLRDSLAIQMSAPDFWEDAGRHAVLTRFAVMDRVKAAAQTMRSLLDRYERSAKHGTGQFSKDLAGRLASQLYLVDHGIRDALGNAPVEVVLSVEAAMESGGDDRATRKWCEQMFAMYVEWAAARRMQIARVGDVRADLPLLVISGFGAHAVLTDEVGLHVLESEGGNARPGAAASRAVARVRVVPTPAESSTEPVSFQRLAGLLAAQAPTPFVVRRYRFEPSPLVRDARKGWRAGRVSDVMAGNFDLFANAQLTRDASDSAH